MRVFHALLRRALPLLTASLLLHGCGEKSSPSAITEPPPTQPPPPGSIGAFAAVPGDGRVTLHWRLPIDGSVASTVIRRKTGSTPTSPNDGELVYEGADTTAVDRSVSNGTTYTYGAWAKSAGGNVNGPVAVTARPLPPAPAPPGAFTATAGSHSVSLAWQNPDAASFDHVRIMLKTGGYPTAPNDGTLVYEGSGTSATWSGLETGVTAYLSAWAYDAFGQRSGAAQTSATPAAEFQDVQVPAWSESHLFPVQLSGDRDFGDRGPAVTAHLHYEVEGSNIVAVLDYRAEETPGGDSTVAAKTFRWTRATIPAGWSFDSWRDDVDQTVSYVDQDNDRDRFPATGSFDPALPIEIIDFLGATKGSDVGVTTNDDTQIWQISARQRTFRLKR